MTKVEDAIKNFMLQAGAQALCPADLTVSLDTEGTLQVQIHGCCDQQVRTLYVLRLCAKHWLTPDVVRVDYRFAASTPN